MTRPNILRADTLDLQDYESPTAAEHAKHPTPTATGNAPHLAGQINHVLEERHSEELALADAWSNTGDLTSEPGAIDHAQADHATDHVTNGSSQEGAGEGVDSEGEVDDDMMDRISSSPSIDDGGYTPSSLPPVARVLQYWPTRSSSLSPVSTSTPTCESFNQTADLTPQSSPFLQTPRHLLIPGRARLVEIRRSPLAWRTDCDSSPSGGVSKVPPPTFPCSSITSKHHQVGWYEPDQEPGLDTEDPGAGPENSETCEQPDMEGEASDADFDLSKGSEQDAPSSDDDDDDDDDEYSEDGRPIESPFRNHSFIANLRFLANPALALESSSGTSSFQSLDLDTLLLPKYDPLLEAPLSPIEEVDSPLRSPASTADLGLEDPDDHDKDNNDDEHDAFIDLDDRFIDSGWGGECLRDTEDIDFEFVYALHTFVATVEGQANATKGDTMVLLDDSNSYWWLVRVVKDSSIGYLPAEHIETPTERLARLNKHRNIDLSATMLSDNSEKSRNPLKKAMRRRNAKTVQFAAPTYVEASDYDYSSDEEEANMIDPYATTPRADQSTQDESEIEREEVKAEIKETQSEGRSSTSSQRASFDREQAATAAQALAAAGVGGDDSQGGLKLMDKTGEFAHLDVHGNSVPTVATEAAPLKSKRTRNTDSFLKDDTIETRKITLTPGILREESRSPTDPPRSNSLESLTKQSSPTDVPKKETKEKKKEPKKGGMLSGLFKSKKKDKKAKDDASETTDADKLSLEGRESPRPSPMGSGKTSPVERATFSPQQMVSNGSVPATMDSTELSRDDGRTFVAELPGSEVAHEMASGNEDDLSNQQRRIDAEVAQQEKSKSSNPLSPITNMLKTGDGHDKPKKAKRAKQRVELDDFDSPQHEADNPFGDQEEGESDRLSESPVEISSHAFMHGTDTIHIPIMGAEDDSEDDAEEPESLTSSPSIIEHPAEPIEDPGELREDNDPTPTAPRSPLPTEERSKSTSTPNRGLSTDSTTSSSQHLSPRPSPMVAQQAWNDGSLRAWLEDGTEVRDMLLMINDKTGVKPVPPSHPLMSGLYVEQRKGVQDMIGQLDGLLGSYLQRKGVRF